MITDNDARAVSPFLREWWSSAT